MASVSNVSDQLTRDHNGRLRRVTAFDYYMTAASAVLCYPCAKLFDTSTAPVSLKPIYEDINWNDVLICAQCKSQIPSEKDKRK